MKSNITVKLVNLTSILGVVTKIVQNIARVVQILTKNLMTVVAIWQNLSTTIQMIRTHKSSIADYGLLRTTNDEFVVIFCHKILSFGLLQ